MFDTHCHPYMTFKKSQEDILENFFRSGGKYLVSIGCDIESSQKSIDLARNHSGVHACIGIHPCDVRADIPSENYISELKTLYREHKDYIVGIGESGLDYYWLKSLSEKQGIAQEELRAAQLDSFRSHINLARELGLPLVIHSRESNEDVLKILQQMQAKNYVFHCYSGNLELAERILEQNPDAMFGFGGVLTFKKSHDLKEVAQNLPLKNIMIETDAPFLTPEPLRGKQENEPAYVRHVLECIIDLRDESAEIITEQIMQNSLNFYNIKEA